MNIKPLETITPDVYGFDDWIAYWDASDEERKNVEKEYKEKLKAEKEKRRAALQEPAK